MLDESTLQWLKKSSACRFCHPGEECTGAPVSAESVGWAGYAYPHSECIHCRYFPQPLGDFRDAAEFEARVAAKMAEPWILSGGKPHCPHNGCIVPLLRQKLKPRDAERICAWCKLKDARLAVEAEMIAEGKGPWRKA